MNSSKSSEMIELDRLATASVVEAPFPFVIVPGFLQGDARKAVDADFPEVEKPGSFPLRSLEYGSAFAALIEELSGSGMTEIVARKLAVDLRDRPVTVTVRGQCSARDGQIHTDSKTKLVTLLLYMNRRDESERGRLRILRSATNLDDFAAEIPPDEGTLLIFRNGPNAWHGFEPVKGPRRVVQINWVTDKSVVRREEARHRVSAFFKRLGNVFGTGKHAAAH
jgi:SM-20-related protein